MTIVATLIGYLVILACCALCFGFAVAMWTNRRDLQYYTRLRGTIHELNTWCSYEFPMAQDIAEFLLADPRRDMSEFRDELRRKYAVLAGEADHA